MKTITKFLPLFFLLALSCKQKNAFQTNASDYNKYLQSTENETIKTAQTELAFWSDKYEKAPNQVSYLLKMAGVNDVLFEATGNVEYLYKAETYLTEANEKFNSGRAPTLRALARNYISQHRFREALVLLEKAEALGEGKTATNKMLFDVHMELGNYEASEKKLTEIRDEKEFDYLIRLAKWYDHKGDLDGAILNMERATKLAEESGNEGLKLWAYSNIADFYGHAGRLQDSYNNYLNVLEIDPNYSYALKGIAWITFSHEHNSQEALRILDSISEKHDTPDYLLLKAEIAEFDGDDELKNNYLAQYFERMNEQEFGEMYNSYNAKLFAEQPSDIDKAIALAEREIDNRPTPQSYDLLAWAYLKSGQKAKALNIAQKYVEGKTSEPEAAYHLAEIYAANGSTSKAKSFKSELLASVYELGPNTEKAIQEL